MLMKSVFRTIRTTFARYLAILAIIALGVGFFAGLRVTKQSMLKTADDYLEELSLYDFRLISTLGFTEEDVDAFRALDGIEGAFGAYSADFITTSESGSDVVLHAHSLSEGVNGLDLIAGRLPTAKNECVLDAKYADENKIGSVISLSENNPEETKNAFSEEAYTVVGIANAAAYLNYERGSTSLAAGTVGGFVYLLPEGFTSQVYHEIYLTIPRAGEIYSDAYEGAPDAVRGGVEALLSERADLRYRTLYDGYAAQLEAAQVLIDQLKVQLGETHPTVLSAEETLAEKRAELAAFTAPVVYTLDRNSNAGYVSLDNDTSIVSGVATVFPLFFFLVAALVCTTTMTRMVGEQRTQNGTLKALGYGNGAILSQYLIYAGSASLVGCIGGFLLGSRLLPMALWEVYQIMYSVNRPVAFVLDWGLFALCTALFLLCSLGATTLVCFRDLRESAAQLIRPKAPAAGKKILLERVTLIWRRLPFLHKISIRNICRYRGRLFMMMLGIGGCTALLLTGFGIWDSIQPMAKNQYTEIDLYDASVNFLSGLDETDENAFLEESGTSRENAAFLYCETVQAVLGDGEKELKLVAYDTPPTGFVDLHDGKKAIAFPTRGEAVIDYRFAHAEGISVGDTLTLRGTGQNTVTVRVSGIFDNYIYDYVYVTRDTLEEAWGEELPTNTAYLRFSDGTDPHEAGAALLGISGVSRMTLTEDMQTRVTNMLGSLGYIIVIVLVCAGALAFIVLYNLTNIAIAERTRELATIKVLGFHAHEQNAYVFRENLILTGLSCVLGIPLGIALLHYVMAQIKVGSFYFGTHISPLSFLLSILITFVFTLIVDLTLKAKIRRINMAEALKAIE